MQEFNRLYHLVREDQDSLKREFLPVLNVEFLKTLPQEIHDHEIVVIVCPTKIYLWDSYVFITVVIEVIVQFCFEVNLRLFCVSFLDFNGLLFL